MCVSRGGMLERAKFPALVCRNEYILFSKVSSLHMQPGAIPLSMRNQVCDGDQSPISTLFTVRHRVESSQWPTRSARVSKSMKWPKLMEARRGEG